MAVILNKDPFTYQQEHDEFLKSLRLFHSGRGSPFDKLPTIGGREVDLYLLYRRVISFGGWRKIVDENVWEQILRDFKVPRGCSNGTQALKFIYVRYLDTYEKIHFHGVDPKQPDVEDDHEGPLRKKVCLPQFGIPLSYNYESHRIHESARAQLGMSTDLIHYNDYAKLEKSLLSGLPNEIDFVINVCTLLSNESRHTLLLEKSPKLLQLLMAHIGIFESDSGSYEMVYEQSWRKLTKRNFIGFWLETVRDEAVRHLIFTNHSYKSNEILGSDVLHMGRDQGLHDKEGQRVMQVAVIMRNLSFEEDNMKFMTESDLVFRFLMLCIHSSYGCLRQLALDTLANISEKFDLCPDENTHMVLQLLKSLTGSDDKYDVVRGLEMVSKLCLVDYNDTVIGESLEEKIIEDIVRLMNVFDIQIIVSSLEALYQLSELGEHTTAKIAAVKHAVDLLVTLLSIEAQSYGPNSLVGIKVVEYCPPSHLAGGIAGSNPPGSAPPVTQPLPPSQKSQHQFPGAPTCDVETTTCNWIQSTFESSQGTTVSQVHMYAEYINFAKKFSLPQILPSHSFFNCVKMVFPDLQQFSIDKPDGLPEIGYRGICKRKTPLPITLSSTVGQNRHRASSVVYTPPIVMNTPNQSSLPTVDLTQTPTLRQRLMEPPKLSALQASPSLLPIGGATPSKQQSAIYTSSKPVTPTQTSAVLKDQAQKSRHLARDSCGKFASSSSKSLHQHIIRKQNMVKIQTNGASPVSQSVVLPQQTGPPGQNIQISSGVDQALSPNPGVYSNYCETKNVKNLLAKKIRTQAPVPIAPKTTQVQQQPPSIDTGGNPMHLLTFTTQQSTVIQGQLQQNLSPQPYLGISSQQMGINSQQFVAQNNASSSPQFVSNTQPHITTNKSFENQSEQCSVQIHGIQSVVDGAQQYVISQPEEAIFDSCVSSSQSSHRSRSPKSEKSKNKSSTSSRSGSRSSRSSSPKRSSPKRQSSTSSRSSSPRSLSPKNYELEVCGEVERAKDVVQVGLEARIERVENRCLNQIKQMNKNISVIPMPSSSHPISSVQPSSQNIILPVIVGSTNTGQTGNFIPSEIVTSNTQSVLINQSDSDSQYASSLPFHISSTQSAQSLDSQPKSNDVVCSTQFNDHPMVDSTRHNNCATIPSNEISKDSLPKQSSLSHSEGSTNINYSQNDVSATVESTKSSVKYVCSQDETEAAVSSLLINNEEESQQSVSNGSDADINVPPTVVNAADETEAAISAITGLLEEDNIEENEDMEDEEEVLDREIINNGQKEEFVQEDNQMIDVNNVESNVNDESYCGAADNLLSVNGDSDSVSEMCTKHSGIILNGGLASPEESEIIPSPISESKCHINGLEGSDSEDIDRKDVNTLNKLASEKLAKLNGISHHIGNGDFEKECSEMQKTRENGMDVSSNPEDILESKSAKQIIGAGDAFVVNGCSDEEMASEDGKKIFNGQIDNVVEVSDKSLRKEKPDSGQCYELASEPDAVLTSDLDEVIIENEMCLQPIVSTVSEPKTSLSDIKTNITEELILKTGTEKDVLDKSLRDPENQNISGNSQKLDEDTEGIDSGTLPDISTGCVDILKAAIESEKIDELDLNGDSNDSLPVVTEGIYSAGIQMTVPNGHIPIGNEMTTTVGSNNISLIPNMFSNVQTSLVVGTIVSINNNILTTSNVPLPYIDNMNTPGKVSVNMEICPNNRHIPTPETSRDSELSCDSIASSVIDSSDKHSITIQQPLIGVQSVPNIQTSNFVSVPNISSQQVITTTIIATGPSQTSPRSTRSSERRPKKRSRNQSGNTESRCSSTSTTASPSLQPVISQPPLPEFMCEWSGCKMCFENTRSVFNHVFKTHLHINIDGVCKWEGCERLQRKKWSLVTHVQDHHCSDAALRVAAIRRIQSQQAGVTATAPTVPALVYPPDAAWQAIRRFEPKPPYAEFNEQREGPVTKHIRLTAALVLRNLARYSSHGRSLIKKHERHINFMAMSALESSNVLANCLWEVLHDH